MQHFMKQLMLLHFTEKAKKKKVYNCDIYPYTRFFHFHPLDFILNLLNFSTSNRLDPLQNHPEIPQYHRQAAKL